MVTVHLWTRFIPFDILGCGRSTCPLHLRRSLDSQEVQALSRLLSLTNQVILPYFFLLARDTSKGLRT